MKLVLVCSHGGHMTELMELQPVWAEHDILMITYHSQRTLPSRAYTFANLSNHPLTIPGVFIRVLRLLRRERPDWIISDGAEIALPVFAAARLLGIRTLFIESVCRVNSTSLTGHLLYPITDVFLVQWPSLVARYGPKARYEGGIL